VARYPHHPQTNNQSQEINMTKMIGGFAALRENHKSNAAIGGLVGL
jgi:hypothetical protein